MKDALKGIVRKGIEKISTFTSVMDVGKGKDLSKMIHGKGFSKDIAVPAKKNPRLMEKISVPKPMGVGNGKDLSKMIHGKGFSMKDIDITPQKNANLNELKKMAKPLLRIDYDSRTKEMAQQLSAKSKSFVELEKEVNQSLGKRVDKVIDESINFHKKNSATVTTIRVSRWRTFRASSYQIRKNSASCCLLGKSPITTRN